MRLILYFSLVCTSSQLVGQKETNYIKSLQENLFPISSEKIFLYEHISDEHSSHLKLDSTITLRKNQPKGDEIQNILNQIIHTQDSSYIIPLQDI